MLVLMKHRDPRDGRGSLGGVGQIFVAFQANRDSDLGFSPGHARRFLHARNRLHFRLLHSQNMAAAADAHALSQSDFGGHSERDLDLGPLLQGSVGKEKDAARAEILSETDAFQGRTALPKRKRKQVGKSLSDTAFDLDWKSGHGRITPNRRNSVRVTLAHNRRREKP